LDEIRVVLADDHPIVRFGVCSALQREPGIKVVGEAADGSQALKFVESMQPDVFVLDVQMPEMDGLSVVREIRPRCPKLNIIVLSAYAYDRYVFRMLAEGVNGYLLKDDAVDYVVDAIRAVTRGQTWLSPQIADKVVQHMIEGKSTACTHEEQLTEREREVLRLVVKGYSNQEAADLLLISERTVRFHVSNLLSKVGVSTRIELTSRAIQRGLVEM